MKLTFLFSMLLLFPLEAYPEPVQLALQTPLELKITVKPPKGRVFNEMAPSKFLVRLSDGWQKEGTLAGEESLLTLAQLKKGENCTIEVKISYFHCDKMGLSQCVRASDSRILEIAGSEFSNSRRLEVLFE